SGTATAEQIEAASRALIRAKTGAQDYARQARIVQNAMRNQAQASRQVAQAQEVNTDALRVQSDQLTGAGRKWGEMAGAMGNVGSVLGTLSPQMGQLGGIIGAVGTASTALTG